MKRALIVILAISFALAAVAATKVLPGAVREVIENALAGERVAVARYDAFAAKASAEGYAGAAALFRAQARAERTHAKRFASLLRAYDLPVPVDSTVAPDTGSTADNLSAARYAETAERDHAYRKAVEICNDLGATEIAELFDQTRDSEVEHANLCAAAARNLQGLQDAKTFYVCDQCGYTTDVKLSFCPACQHKKALAGVH